jgi:hypothetical protein
MQPVAAKYRLKPQSLCGVMWIFVGGKRRVHLAARERGSA